MIIVFVFLINIMFLFSIFHFIYTEGFPFLFKITIVMSKKISAFYDDELNAWLHSISFYMTELSNLSYRLKEIVERNSIVDIASKADVHQLILENTRNKFEELRIVIFEQKKFLMEKEILIADKMVTKEIEQKQKEITLSFKKIELDHINVKFHCNEFLNEMLRK